MMNGQGWEHLFTWTSGGTTLGREAPPPTPFQLLVGLWRHLATKAYQGDTDLPPEEEALVPTQFLLPPFPHLSL